MKNYAVFFHYTNDDESDAVYLFDTIEDAKAMLLDHLNPGLCSGGNNVEYRCYINKDCTHAKIHVSYLGDCDSDDDYSEIRVVRVFE